ncbi:MAG: hypothetical protein GKS05_12085 [Nitrospirales bacterium]|nr:hypothetical protein [Nitrospirales bacterium]
MAIEVRQMTIKSTVMQRDTSGDRVLPDREDLEKVKKDIRAECKQFIIDLLREQQER